MATGTFTTAQSLSDQEAVAALRAGVTTAFDVLTERYYGLVLRYLRTATGDWELAEDLAQEVFLDAFRHLDQLADEQRFAPWLFRITQNRLRMQIRHDRSKRAVSLDWLLEQARPPRPLSSGSGLASAIAERDLIRASVDALSAPLRTAFLLHEVVGLTAPEIAWLLGISRPAAERRISRGKSAFRHSYDGLTREARCREAATNVT